MELGYLYTLNSELWGNTVQLPDGWGILDGDGCDRLWTLARSFWLCTYSIPIIDG